MYVYMTINRINGRKYIGRDSKRRPGYLGSGIFLKQAIKLYGRENFERVNLEECSSLRELIDREKYWIEAYDAVKSEEFYNMSEGTGGFGPDDRHSEETKRLISERCRGKKLTKEQRERLSANQSGREPWNKGRSTGPRRIERISSRIDHDTMKSILTDYETGEFSFAELSAKYGRTVKNAQIKRYREKLETATRGSGGSTNR